MPGLFDDLLVIDCASFIAGPAAATIMSDYGARVIKVEPPGVGDSYRSLIKNLGRDDVVDHYWTLDSRNKESLALDLKDASARSVLDKLIRKADVFITNYPFPIRARLRIRAEDVMPRNRRLIYASLSPYGERGPERDRTAFDTTAWWARSGLMELVRASGQAEHAFSVPGMGDHPTAVALYAAILTALYKRQITGEGSEVSTSLLANGLWSNGCQVQAALCANEVPPRPPRGSRSALTEYYETEDGRLFALVLVNAAREWPLFLRAVGKEAWLEDPSFATPTARMENAAQLWQAMGELFRGKPWAHWHELFDRAGITYGLVGRIADHASDPQVLENDLLPAFVDGDGLKTLDSPLQIAGEKKQPPRMAPALGAHTRAILEECGLSAAEIESLGVQSPEGRI